MIKLSCLALFKESLAFTGRHFGSLCRWMIPPMLLCTAAVLPAVLLHILKDVWALYIPAGLFCLFAWVPYCLRLNQLAVLGEVEPGGYVGMIFTGKSVRYVLYITILTLLTSAGIVLALLPWLLSMKGGPDGLMGMIAPGGVSFVMMAVFFVLTAPLHLIFPATAVEPRPAMGKMFPLAEGNRLRLLLAWVLATVVFALLNLLAEALAGMISPEAAEGANLYMAPLRITLSWVSSIVSMTITAVAYRRLRGLPDPAQPALAAPGGGAAYLSGPEGGGDGV